MDPYSYRPRRRSEDGRKRGRADVPVHGRAEEDAPREPREESSRARQAPPRSERRHGSYRGIPGVDRPLPQDVRSSGGKGAGGRLMSRGRGFDGFSHTYVKRGRATIRRTGRGGRRRGAARAFFALAALLLLVAATLFVLTRPSSVEIVASPKDATITLGDASGTGRLLIRDIEPGTYRVRVARKGFKPRRRTIEVRRRQRVQLHVKLKPLPLEVRLVTHPEDAAIELTAGGKTISGKGVWAGKLDAGEVMLAVSASGYNTFRQRVSLDASRTLEVWLDPEGQLVRSVAIFGCGPAPKGIALTPDGSEAWVTMLGGPPSVEVYDPRTGERIGSVDLGEDGAVEVVFSADGKRAYVSQMETARVYEIDVRSRKPLRTFDTQSAWTKVVALAHDGKTLFAANWSGDDVSEWDVYSGELRRRLPTVDTPRGLFPTADGRHLYVAGFGAGVIERVDLADGSRTKVFSSGGALRHLVADEKRGILYASDMAKDKIWKIDLASGKTTALAATDHKPNTIDLSPDGRVLFVCCRGANNPKSYYIPGPEWGSVQLFDTETGELLDAVVGGNQCTALDLSADGSLLLFSDFLDNRLRVYEVPPYAELKDGGGGRARTYKAELRKEGASSAGSASPHGSVD